MYACNPEKPSGSPSSEMSAEPRVASLPAPDREHHEDSSQISSQNREVVDIISQAHGPRFLALAPMERQAIVKCHKNLGHPSTERLKILMKQQSFRPEMIDAVDDYRCSVCLESKGPSLCRPAADREPLDFNDRVSMDGIQWMVSSGRTNKAPVFTSIMLLTMPPVFMLQGSPRIEPRNK